MQDRSVFQARIAAGMCLILIAWIPAASGIGEDLGIVAIEGGPTFSCLTSGGTDPLLCPDSTPNGASCVAHGILITERDNTGGLIGDVAVDLSQSRAWTLADPGPWPPNGGEHNGVRPPGDPSAHADAHQVGVAYTNPSLLGGLSISAEAVFSQCDVLALFDPSMGLYTEAYGRAGAADVAIASGMLGPIGAEVLDFEASAVGLPWITMASMSCDVVELQALGPTLQYCPPPNSGGSAGIVSVVVNEEWGPFPNPAGQWVYGGAALHVTVATSLTTVDVYVGYVAIAVTGGPPLPPMWVNTSTVSIAVPKI